MIATLLAFAFAALTPTPVAGPFEIRGRLVVDGVGVDGLHDFAVTFRDNDGIEVGSFDASGIVVVGGDFNFAMADDDAFYAAAANGDLVIEVAIVDEFDVSAVAVVGAVPYAAAAGAAAFAAFADEADTLGTLAATDLVSAAALASPAGSLSVALSNVAVPLDILDGDQGTIDAVGSGLVNTTVLDVAPASVDGARVIDGTVRSAAIEDGSISSVNVGSTASADLQNNTLTGADFGLGGIQSTRVAGNKTALFRNPLACDLEEQLTTLSTSCLKRTCSTAGQVRDCVTGSCVVGTATTCARTFVGDTLFAP